MAEGSVIYALVAVAIAVAGMAQEQLLALPMQAVYLTMILYVLCTFKLSFSQAHPIRTLVTGYFLTFGSGFLTTLMTGQPLSPLLPVLSAEYLFFYGVFTMLTHEQVAAFFRLHALRAGLYLGVAFIKSNAMVRTLYPMLEHDFSLGTVAGAMAIGVVQMLSGPLVYCVDLLVASRLERFTTAALKKFVQVGFVLTAVVVTASYYTLFLLDPVTSKTHGKAFVLTAAHVSFFLFYGSEALAYGRNFHTKVV